MVDTRRAIITSCLGMAILLSPTLYAQDVLTQHNDNARTGAYLGETTLNSSNVNGRSFGKLFERAVDGAIYGQPLYVSGVQMTADRKRNVVYVATMHNSVYAFDADDPAASAPLWHVQLGPPVSPQDPMLSRAGGYPDIATEIGITSTPVISLDHRAIYAVSFNKNGGEYSHSLHALDLVTGKQLFNGPRNISVSVPGTGMGSASGIVHLTHHRANQRAALLLSNDTIYVAFGSFADIPPYQGWVLAYSASTLEPVHAPFVAAPDGYQGGIWQGGQGPAADNQGNLYFLTSNGSYGHALAGNILVPGASIGTPALVGFEDKQLVMAWTASVTDHYLNIAMSEDGQALSNIVVLKEKSLDGPALAAGNGRLFLAWIASDRERRINLISTTNPKSFGGKISLDASSEYAPALAYGQNRLFIAWTGADAKRSLNVMSSSDGRNFGHRVTLLEGSRSAPSLSYIDGTLYLMWRGQDRSLNIMTSTDGETFSAKRIVREESDFAPAFVRAGGKELLLAWTGRGANNPLHMLSGANIGQLARKEAIRSYSAASGPVFATFKGKNFIAWRARNYPFRVNLAAVSSRFSLGNSAVKLGADLSVADWFAPWNGDDLSNQDVDLGSAGVLLIPDTNLLVGLGKEGRLYLLNRGDMGGLCTECNASTGETKIPQSFPATGLPNRGLQPLPTARFSHGNHQVSHGPVFWHSPNRGQLLYVWGEGDWLRAYRFNGRRFDAVPADISAASVTTPPSSMPGGMLSISANGSRPGTGILWATHPVDADANRQVVRGMLRAIDASDLSRELWNSTQNATRDELGNCSKFSAPTVANGKVYVATFSNKLVVYGLLL